MMDLLAHNEAETLAIGRAVGRLLRPGDVVAINGDLGAGKTRLVRGIALAMGFEGSVVSSPTYVLVNEYELPEEDGLLLSPGNLAAEPVNPASPRAPSPVRATPRRLFHVDAYRLGGPDDLDSLGWDRVVRDPAQSDSAVVIEWAERIAGALTGLPEAEHRLCRVRMEAEGSPHSHPPLPPGDAEDDGADGAGVRRIRIDPPKAWAWRDGWRDLLLVQRLLPADPGASAAPAGDKARAGLPAGWARCPATGRAVPPDAPWFPFVDSRSRMTDLGRWITGSYTLSRELRPEDEPDDIQ